MTTYDFFDPNTSRQWVNVFLQGIYQKKVVFEEAVMSVTPQELSQHMQATYAQVLVYQGLVSYWGEFKEIAPGAALGIAVQKLISQLAIPQDQRDSIAAEAGALYSNVMMVAASEQIFTLAMSITKKLYQRSRIDPELSRILSTSSHTGATVDDVLNQVTTLRGKTRSDKVPVNVFRMPKSKALGKEFSSGLAWFDELVGGSLRSGEGYAILAETGGGKTTVTANLACALATQGKKVVVVVTEQRLDETHLIAKYWATMAKKDWKEFEQYSEPSEVPDDLMSPELKAQIKLIENNILAFDKEQIRTIEDIRSIVMSHRPDVFMVDWAGTLADQLMLDRNNQWNGDRNLCLRAIATEVNDISKDSGAAGIVFQQIAPNAGKNPFREYDHTMAAECKTFCWNLSYAIVLFPRDGNDIMKVACTKSRLGARKARMVRLNGAWATLEPVDGYKRGTKGVWVKGSDADFGTMPKDKKAAGPF